jgi:hypothetical protein
MRKAVRLVVVCALVFSPGILLAGERFDGKWLTTLTCPEKGKTEGYTWKFPSLVTAGNLRGEHGSAGEPGYLLIEGKIADDGAAKLSASGIVTSRKYARGVFTSEGSDYSYKIKAQFQDKQGTGTRDQGLGIVGRPCTFDFVKQEDTNKTGGS